MSVHLFRCHCVSLAYNWDDVDLIVQLLHKLDVQRFQPWKRSKVTIDKFAKIKNKLDDEVQFQTEKILLPTFITK